MQVAHILGAHILLHDPRLGTHKEDLEKDRRVEEAFRWPSNELLGCMGSDQCEMQPTSFPLVREKKNLWCGKYRNQGEEAHFVSVFCIQTQVFSLGQC